MAKYLVAIFETLHKNIVVDADSYSEAEQKVRQAYENGEIPMTMDYFVEGMTDYDGCEFDAAAIEDFGEPDQSI